MKITEEKIGFYAENILKFLEENSINKIEDLKGRLGNIYPLNREKGIALELTLRPSSLNSVITLSLIVEKEGIPIEIRAHDDFDYWHCVVKCYEKIPNYKIFGEDRFGNKMQLKLLENC